MEILTQKIDPVALAAAGFTQMEIPEETIFSGNIDSQQQVASYLYSILDNDTLRTIAAKTSTDWQVIATINGLEAPYIAKSPLDTLSSAIEASTLFSSTPAGGQTINVPGLHASVGEIVSLKQSSILFQVVGINKDVLTVTPPAPVTIPAGEPISLHERFLTVALAGQKIKIPSGGQQQTSVVNYDESLTFEEALYGIDEYLDESGDIIADQKQDIQTIHGISNLEMQLWHRIMTLKGELTELGHPEYGSNVPLFIGKPQTTIWMERILFECQMAVAADPRIASITSGDFYNDGTTLYYTAVVLPINSTEPINIAVPLR